MFNPIKLLPSLAHPSNQNKSLRSGSCHVAYSCQLTQGCVPMPLSTVSTGISREGESHIMYCQPAHTSVSCLPQTVTCLTEKRNHKSHRTRVPHFLCKQMDAQDS